jgi:hypothetical protein
MTKNKRGAYRVVAVSLYEEEAADADRLTDVLKRAGWPKANRSLIVREALRVLAEDLGDRTEEGVFRYFVERYARRLGGSRAPQSDATTAPAASDDSPESGQDLRPAIQRPSAKH